MTLLAPHQSILIYPVLARPAIGCQVAAFGDREIQTLGIVSGFFRLALEPVVSEKYRHFVLIDMLEVDRMVGQTCLYFFDVHQGRLHGTGGREVPPFDARHSPDVARPIFEADFVRQPLFGPFQYNLCGSSKGRMPPVCAFKAG